MVLVWREISKQPDARIFSATTRLDGKSGGKSQGCVASARCLCGIISSPFSPLLKFFVFVFVFVFVFLFVTLTKPTRRYFMIKGMSCQFILKTIGGAT
jgi:hypothetical protein